METTGKPLDAGAGGKPSQIAFFATCVEFSAGVAKSQYSIPECKAVDAGFVAKFSRKTSRFCNSENIHPEAHGLLETFTRFLRLLKVRNTMLQKGAT
jgi:hypothetical protein